MSSAIESNIDNQLLDHQKNNLIQKQSLRELSKATKAPKVTKAPKETKAPKAPQVPLLLWQKLGADIAGEESGDLSGWSVSLSSNGNIVAIGAPNNDGNGAPRSGRVRIYQWSESTSAWTQMGEDINGESSGDSSGHSVSLSSNGNIVAIGAPSNDGNGAVHIYQWSESTSAWTQMGEDIAGEAIYDYSGRSVSLSSNGNIVAIGATGNDGNGAPNSGHVRMFQWSESTFPPAWIQMGKDINGESSGDTSGRSVSLSSNGNIVAIGAPWSDGNGPGSGHVRIYQWSESTSAWTQMGEDIDGETGDHSGWSVSLSSNGNIVATGAPWSDGNGPTYSGHVRMFQWSESAWTQMGEDIDGEVSYDLSGFSVSLSSNGNIVAIGAPNNDGNGAPDSGHVRIYQWLESTSPPAWTQMGEDIDGESYYDSSGQSVSLSSNGNIVAIGAPYNDSGHVRIYQWV